MCEKKPNKPNRKRMENQNDDNLNVYINKKIIKPRYHSGINEIKQK